ncbi:MAG: CpsD/CapB family tyrosine-protein kinase [Chakrabartia sp.]
MSIENSRFPTPVAVNIIPNPLRLKTAEIETDILEDHNIVGYNSRDIRARPFNLLRTQILKEMRNKNWKLLGITSATPEAGKSFLAANLAVALAQLPEIRVFLFDLDLRRASLAEKFGIDGDIGLTQFLDGSVDNLLDIGRQLTNLNLTLFPCYHARVNSAEILSGERFQTLIDAMRALPDDVVIICDLPPAFANDDAMAIIQQLDSYLFVIEEGITTKAQVRDAMQLFAPAPCIGTVLNRYQPNTSENFGYGGKYDRYYGD